MAFPTSGILDNFNRGDEGPPPSASWTDIVAGHEVVALQCVCDTDAGWDWSVWSAAQFGPDCEAYATEANAFGANFVVARVTNTGAETWDGYAIYDEVYNGEVEIRRFDDGSSTVLGATEMWQSEDGDKIGIECVGTTITFYVDDGGIGWAALFNRTDATYDAPGYIGIGTYRTAQEWDDFGGGTIGAPPAAITLPVLAMDGVHSVIFGGQVVR